MSALNWTWQGYTPAELQEAAEQIKTVSWAAFDCIWAIINQENAFFEGAALEAAERAAADADGE